MRRTTLKAYAILSVVFGMTGMACGSDGSHTTAEAPAAPAHAGATWYVEHLPLGAFPQQVADVHRQLDLALGRVIDPCMQNLGFSYDQRDIPPTIIKFRRYGILDDVARVTYTPAVAAHDESGPPPLSVPIDEAYAVALYGAVNSPQPSTIKDSDGQVVGLSYEQGGCLGKAEAEVTNNSYADFQTADIMVQSLYERVTEALWADKRTVAAIQPWVDCMIAKGAPPPDRLDYYIASHEWTGADLDLQTRVVIEERECGNATDVVAEVFKIDYEMQSEIFEANAELFRAFAGYADQFAKAG